MTNYYCVILLTIFPSYFHDFQIHKSTCRSKSHMYWYIILTAIKSFKIPADPTCVVSHLLDVEDLTAEVAAHSDHSSYTGIHT